MTLRSLALPLLALLAASAPARGAEGLTAETLLPGHRAADASKPSLAYGDGVYLLAWQAGHNEEADIVGLRLDKAGKPMETQPFVICGAKDTQERPRVAFGGQGFLVVWHDLRNGKDWDVYAARVSAEGNVLDPDGIAVAQGERNQCEPGVCFDGKAFQVLWRGFRGEKEDAVDVNRRPDAGYHVYGGRVSAEGQVLADAGVFMAKPPREYLTPRSMGMAAAVALPSGQLLAAARSGTSLCLWRLTDGKPSSEPALLAKKGGFLGFDDAAFATDGKSVLLVWTTFRDGGGRSSGADKSGLVVLGADAPLVPTLPRGDEKSAAPAATTLMPRSLSSAEREPRVRHPSPAWDGRRYIVAWDVPRRGKEFSYEAVFVRCFASDGTPLGNDEPLADEPGSPAYWPAVASDGAGTTLIAYERHPRTGDTPIRIGFRLLTAK